MESITASGGSPTTGMTDGSTTIVGTNTAFITDLHRGQRLFTENNRIIVVKEVTDDTHFEATQPMDVTVSGQDAYKMRNLFPLNRKRGSLSTGNALEYDRGTLLAVGSGALYVDRLSLAR